MTTKRFLTMTEACERLGITLPTLRLAIERLGVRQYGSLVDHRTKIVRIEDVERIAQARSKEVVVELTE